VRGNYIGTDAAGTLDRGNTGTGITIQLGANGNQIGGTSAGERNVISGNTGLGIWIVDDNTANNTVQGNYIGTDASGSAALGNDDAGIFILSNAGGSGNVVGGPAAGAGNIIAHNGQAGVVVSANGAINNPIRGNSIFANGGLGIDLQANGVTANDAGDADTGPNNLQNFPVITSALVTGSTRTITGTLNSASGQTFNVDFYSSASCNGSAPNDFGEGQTYLGSTATGMTDGNGDVSFTFNPSALTAGQFITATATDTSGNTSEFSQCFASAGGTPGAIVFTSSTYTVGEGGGTAHLNVTRSGGSDGSISATFNTSDGTATAGSDYTAVTGYTVTYADGEMGDKTIDIPISEDMVYEGDETINLSLSSTSVNLSVVGPLNATLTIIDNETPPLVSINDVTVNEGQSGTTSLNFTVSLSGPSAFPVTVNYQTANSTAHAPGDYTSASGMVSFPASNTSQPLSLTAFGDTVIEGNETFFVNLSGPSGATLGDAQGLATLDNDDGPTNRRVFTKFDFDGDSKADIATWDGASGNWHVINSNGGVEAVQFDWGSSGLGDMLVPADYDGDGHIDFAVFRPSEGNWYIIQSSTTTSVVENWGQAGDVPVPGDYDGDNRTDVAVFRASEGNWYIRNSRDGSVTLRNWGVATDQPVPGDYDGDRMTDIAVYRASEGNWYIINSSTGAVTLVNWGAGSDRPVPADYDGDGKTDITIFRAAGNWYIRNSGGGVTLRNWGNASDKLVPGDYDGDGKTDIAVYRPSEGVWYVINSHNNTGSNYYLGGGGEVPVPSAYIH